MKRWAMVFAMLFFSTGAFAVDFGLRYGTSNDIDEDFVGAELVFPFGNWSFNPSLEYYLTSGDEADLWTLNADFNYHFNRGGTVSPYLGLGAAFSRIEFNGFDDDEVLANLNGGLAFQLGGGLAPYIQGRYFRSVENSDFDDFAVMVGLRF